MRHRWRRCNKYAHVDFEAALVFQTKAGGGAGDALCPLAVDVGGVADVTDLDRLVGGQMQGRRYPRACVHGRVRERERVCVCVCVWLSVCV